MKLFQDGGYNQVFGSQVCKKCASERSTLGCRNASKVMSESKRPREVEGVAEGAEDTLFKNARVLGAVLDFELIYQHHHVFEVHNHGAVLLKDVEAKQAVSQIVELGLRFLFLQQNLD